MITIPAGEFKAKCLALLDNVAQTHEKIIITKYGKPVAQLVPLEIDIENHENLLKDSILFEKDIISPSGEEWDAEK
jgi:prevent-host-death family protein